jgi:hypothetical protein
MTDRLSPQARALLQGARGASDPTGEDHDRVYAALAARIAAGVAATGAAVGGGVQAAGAHAGAGVVAKLALVLTAVGALAVVTTAALRNEPDSAGRTAGTIAPASPAPAEKLREELVLPEAPPPGELPGGTWPRQLPDLSRRAAVGGDRTWYCASPAGSTSEVIHEVRIAVTVRPDGTPASVEVLSDAGAGRFARAATRCAMRKRYLPARDANGRPIEGRTLPFTVHYAR